MNLEPWNGLGCNLKDHLALHPKMGIPLDQVAPIPSKMALHTPRVEQPQLLWVLTLPIGNKMFSSSPTPILFSGVSLTKLAPGFFFFPLKTHSLQNRQKTQIKGYPEPKIWFLQPPKMETNTCFRANSTRPKTFLVTLWAPK